MGNRYILTVICPECGLEDDDVYYAPTRRFTAHKCSGCGFEINLEEYTGITYEDASNRQELEQIVSEIPKMVTRFKCVICGKLTAGKIPPDGDLSERYPRRHGSKYGNPCPGCFQFAKWVDVEKGEKQ